MRHGFFHSWACAALVVLSACGDDDPIEQPSDRDDSGTMDAGSRDAGGHDAGAMDSAVADGAPADASAPDCFEDPQTHEEIINACTDAEFVDKDPELPLLLPDGGLPPLP